MEPDRPETPLARGAAKVLHWSEDALYFAAALVLVAGAAIVLADAAYGLFTEVRDDVALAIEHTLDALLIVFILIELLSAVRETMRKRQLVAEPFLLIGMIASIKEIVVLSVFAVDDADAGDTALLIGVLGAVVVGLSVALLLLRQKEEHPTE
jgi:uncharacterized membrane protein (DUF373 family)